MRLLGLFFFLSVWYAKSKSIFVCVCARMCNTQRYKLSEWISVVAVHLPLPHCGWYTFNCSNSAFYGFCGFVTMQIRQCGRVSLKCKPAFKTGFSFSSSIVFHLFFLFNAFSCSFLMENWMENYSPENRGWLCVCACAHFNCMHINVWPFVTIRNCKKSKTVGSNIVCSSS